LEQIAEVAGPIKPDAIDPRCRGEIPLLWGEKKGHLEKEELIQIIQTIQLLGSMLVFFLMGVWLKES